MDIVVELMPRALRLRVVEHERMLEWLEKLEWRP